jgi:TubC N-terminal docking domain
MTATDELLADCRARAIVLVPSQNGTLTIDGPRAVLTPDYIDRLKANKAAILAALLPMPAKRRGICRRCGHCDAADVPIHTGQSVRRDCARCGRFVEFALWYGRNLN